MNTDAANRWNDHANTRAKLLAVDIVERAARSALLLGGTLADHVPHSFDVSNRDIASDDISMRVLALLAQLGFVFPDTSRTYA